MNIYMDYSYIYGSMTWEHGSHPHHTDTVKWERSTEVRARFRLGSRSSLVVEAQLYSYWSGGNNQRQELRMPPFRMPTGLDQCKVYDATDDEPPLLSPTNFANFQSPRADSNCWMKNSSLTVIGWPLLNMTIKNQNCMQELVNTCRTLIGKAEQCSYV